MSRNDYVQQLLAQLSVEQQSEMVNSTEWWWIPAGDHWRLTWDGYAYLTDLKLESWEFDFALKDIKPWMYLTLSRNLQVPFYIVDNKKHAKLVVFDSKSAVMISLYGDLIRWIKSIK